MAANPYPFPTDEPKITLTRTELFKLMGELALPPFYGHPEADSWECGSLAIIIIKRVDELFDGH